MDFDLSDEHEQLRQSVLALARDALNDDLRARDAAHEFPTAAWLQCAKAGLTGLPVPVEHGGQGAGALSAVVALEALGYACHDNGLIFSLNAHLWAAVTPIVRFGDEQQKARYLPGMCDGSIIGSTAMTEPGSGSDAFALTTRYEERGDRFVLDGQKAFVTNAPVADVFVVYATADRSAGWAGISAFLVDRDTPGLVVGPPLDKMGLKTSPLGEIYFDGCELGADARLGPKGAGMAVFNHSMDWERGCILASSVGTMQRQLETCVAYARERQQFGQPIGKFQAVSHRVADMKVRLEAARLLLQKQAWLRDRDRRADLDSATVKLYLSEAWVQSSLDQLIIHGGAGYLTETGIERDLRDALGSGIYSGTNDIQRNIIASRLGL